MLKKYAAALAFGLPLAALASEPVDMSCNMSVKSFFAPLVQRHLIDTKPYLVDEHSRNYFRPKMFAHLAAYGMQVTGVVGSADEPLLFIKKGNAPGGDLYGVIVRESIANVQAQLNSAGVTAAKAFRFDGRQTIITCLGVSQ